MRFKNSDLKALAYQLKKAKRNHDQTMIDKVEEERRVFHLNSVSYYQVSRRKRPKQQLCEDWHETGDISTVEENCNAESSRIY